MKLTTTAIVTIILSICAVVSIIFFVMLPLWKNINATKTDKEVLNSDLQNTQKKYSFLESIEQNKDKINQYSTLAEKLIPSKPDIENITLELESFSKQLPLKDTSFSSPNLAEASKGTAAGATISLTILKGLTTHPFTISGGGTLDNIYAILDRINNLSRLAEVNSFNLTSGSTGTNTNTSTDTDSDRESPNIITVQISGNFFSDQGNLLTKETQTFNQSILDKASSYLANRKSYSSPIDISKETGFGRQNPFLP